MKLLAIFTQIISVRSFSDSFRSWVINDYIPKHTKADDWWDNPIIHNLGNSGVGGAIHARFASVATDLIDEFAYGGVDVRHEISEHIASRLSNRRSVIGVDFGCGVGKSTISLSNALKRNFNNFQVYGLDTSEHMLKVARKIGDDSTIYTKANVSDMPLRHLKDRVDVVTIFYMMHEAPRSGHYAVLRSAWNLLRDQGIVAVVDISLDYEPSTSMLLGEPYLLGYKESFEATIDHVLDSRKFRQYKGDDLFTDWVPGHVQVTILRKDNGI